MTTITIPRALLEQALEAMQIAAAELDSPYTSETPEERVLRAAINNLRAALAQEQAEPSIDGYPLWSGMPPPEPQVHYEGPVAFHTQRCAVLPGQHAVLQMNTGVFHPSWAAQEQGWRLVRADTWLRKRVLRLFGDA